MAKGDWDFFSATDTKLTQESSIPELAWPPHPLSSRPVDSYPGAPFHLQLLDQGGLGQPPCLCAATFGTFGGGCSELFVPL